MTKSIFTSKVSGTLNNFSYFVFFSNEHPVLKIHSLKVDWQI